MFVNKGKEASDIKKKKKFSSFQNLNLKLHMKQLS